MADRIGQLKCLYLLDSQQVVGKAFGRFSADARELGKLFDKIRN